MALAFLTLEGQVGAAMMKGGLGSTGLGTDLAGCPELGGDCKEG